jgi:hypothetical protein
MDMMHAVNNAVLIFARFLAAGLAELWEADTS